MTCHQGRPYTPDVQDPLGQAAPDHPSARSMILQVFSRAGGDGLSPAAPAPEEKWEEVRPPATSGPPLRVIGRSRQAQPDRSSQHIWYGGVGSASIALNR